MFYRVRQFFSRRAFKVKRVETNLPVTLKAASILAVPTYNEGTPRVALTGRHYQLYAVSEEGQYEPLRRVKSFTFHADADRAATFTVEYYDHDKASL